MPRVFNFKSRADFMEELARRDLTPANCVFAAAHKLVDNVFAMGSVPIETPDTVRQEFARIGSNPLEVTTDTSDADVDKHKAELLCAACGMCVVIKGGFQDYQMVSSPDTQTAECPVFDNTKTPPATV